MAANLNTVEIKAFVPARDFEQSRSFYQAVGFTLASDTQGVAYFYHGHCSFLLQNFYEKTLAENLMMHLLVEDVEAWHTAVTERKIATTLTVAFASMPWPLMKSISV